MALPVKYARGDQIDPEPADRFTVRKHEIAVPDFRPAEFPGRFMVQETVVRDGIRLDGADREWNARRFRRFLYGNADIVDIHRDRNMALDQHFEGMDVCRGAVGAGKVFALARRVTQRNSLAVFALTENSLPRGIKKDEAELRVFRIRSGRIVEIDAGRDRDCASRRNLRRNCPGRLIIGGAVFAEFDAVLRRIETGPDQLPAFHIRGK